MRHIGLLLVSTALFIPEVASGKEENASTASVAADTSGETVSTGVARARDRLNSATSTSAMPQSEILHLAPRSLGEILRQLPGIRAEVGSGETSTNLSIRGLPLSSTGAKYVQIQEDGLPILEYGDINLMTPDAFVRFDLGVAQVQAIRGGSASTFASNSPGGIINLISGTGETEGGTIQLSSGLDYRDSRIDAEFGGKLSDNTRFQISGFFRHGEGPRAVGYNANHGGQVRFNITRTLPSGYIRLSAKLLDDRTPFYAPVPVLFSATQGETRLASIPNFDIGAGSILSRNFSTNLTLDKANNPILSNMRDGVKTRVRSIGLEAQFEVAGWTVTERLRAAENSGHYTSVIPVFTDTADTIATILGGPGSTLRYATGSRAGSAADAATIGGNGLLAQALALDVDIDSMSNVTNDVRASRVWNVGSGELTTTAGFYKSLQKLSTNWRFTSIVSELRSDGTASLVDVIAANQQPVTQKGVYAYGAAFFGDCCRRVYDVDYDTNAAFGSVNYQTGPLALGASLRYDFGSARGSLIGSELDGSSPVGSLDMNRDGNISAAETRVALLPIGKTGAVDYDYDYLSYSASINYRLRQDMSLFGRYSRGGRTNSDRLLFTGIVDSNSGKLNAPDSLVDIVKQAEVGFKYRTNSFSFNATGFLVNASENNLFFNQVIARTYQTYGLEVEANLRRGHFSLAASATYTHGKITSDSFTAAVEGKKPPRQPSLFYTLAPSYDTSVFTVGAFLSGTTSSWADDTNSIRMPGFVTVSPFLILKAAKNLEVSINANNVFNVRGYHLLDTLSYAGNGFMTAQVINPRTISASARMRF